MTRPGKSPRRQALAELFAADAEAAVLHVLQRSDAPLTAGEIKEALRTGGVAKADANRRWPGLQRRIRAHDHVIFRTDHRYRWTAQPPEVSPVEALELIVKGRPGATRRAELVATVRAALTGTSAELEAAARRRQAEIDAVRALAELASDVEELTANEAAPDVLVFRVRARVKRSGLEPIERAGEETTFDRRRHKPIGGSMRDGARVVVVRPGYVWKASTEDVVIAKAIVEE